MFDIVTDHTLIDSGMNLHTVDNMFICELDLESYVFKHHLNKVVK